MSNRQPYHCTKCGTASIIYSNYEIEAPRCAKCKEVMSEGDMPIQPLTPYTFQSTQHQEFISKFCAVATAQNQPPKEPVREHPEAHEDIDTTGPEMSLGRILDRIIQICKRDEGCPCRNCRQDRVNLGGFIERKYQESILCKADSEIEKPWNPSNGHYIIRPDRYTY